MSYRDTYRRHRKLFYTPIVLGAVAAALVLFAASKSYKSVANLWIDTAPPAQSSVSPNASAPLAQPPATAEQGILGELLTTSSFDTSVAQHSLLGRSLGSLASIRKNAPTLLGTGQVIPTATGAQILQISYSASSQAMAQSVLGAVITQLQGYSDRLISQHDQSAVAYDRQQVKIAEGALATARSNVKSYQAQHPGVTQADPTYVSLVSAENNAVTQVAQANTALSQAGGGGSTNGWSIQVVDPPSQAVSSVGKKKMFEVILGGALGGLLVSFLGLIALTPAKKEDELPFEKSLVPDLAPADPFPAEARGVSPGFAQSRPDSAVIGSPRVHTGARRFTYRNPPEPIEER